jgi:folate-dependent phosphoribosylglycinamide formyltransferase PurN
LAGFLSKYIYPPSFENRVMNVHPALIPAFSGKGFYGMKVHNAVVAHGVKVTGCTVHFADKEYDHGAIILQKTCPITSCDTAHTVADKVFALELIAFPEAVRLFFDEKLTISNNRVIIAGDKC